MELHRAWRIDAYFNESRGEDCIGLSVPVTREDVGKLLEVSKEEEIENEFAVIRLRRVFDGLEEDGDVKVTYRIY